MVHRLCLLGNLKQSVSGSVVSEVLGWFHSSISELPNRKPAFPCGDLGDTFHFHCSCKRVKGSGRKQRRNIDSNVVDTAVLYQNKMECYRLKI